MITPWWPWLVVSGLLQLATIDDLSLLSAFQIALLCCGLYLLGELLWRAWRGEWGWWI